MKKKKKKSFFNTKNSWVYVVRGQFSKKFWINSKKYFTKVLYMSFDRFLLAVESRDLSQADKSIKRVPSFPKLSDG
jgi:hypothetical protein